MEFLRKYSIHGDEDIFSSRHAMPDVPVDRFIRVYLFLQVLPTTTRLLSQSSAPYNDQTRSLNTVRRIGRVMFEFSGIIVGLVRGIVSEQVRHQLHASIWRQTDNVCFGDVFCDAGRFVAFNVD